MRELKRRKIEDIDTYAPYYIISYACHCFNLINLKEKIYYEGGGIPNMRLHLVNIGAPGTGKSYMMKQMGHADYGIFAGTSKKFQFEGNMSESGLSGSFFRTATGETQTIEGAAYENKYGFILFDEFSALHDAMRQSYNSNLETQLLQALDSGMINKRLSGGRISYDTNFTLWGGVQPVRTNLSRGLGRRLCVLLHKTNLSDTEKMIDAQFESMNVTFNAHELENMRRSIDYWANSFSMIRRIDFDVSIKKFYKRLGTHHNNIPIYNKILLGYVLAKYGAEKYLTISDDEVEAIKLIEQEEEWRDDVMSGSDLMQILDLIMQFGQGLGDGTFIIPKAKLMKVGSKIHLTLEVMDEMIKKLHKMGMFEIKANVIQYKHTEGDIEKCQSLSASK